MLIVKGLAENKVTEKVVDGIPGKMIKNVKKVVERIRTVVVWKYLVEGMMTENGTMKDVPKLL